MKSLNDISNEIGAWADKNFKDTSIAEIGALEEIGEAAHCIAKRAQGIRGFDKEDYFIEQLTDALGDIGVYVLHFCFVEKISPPAEYGLLALGYNENDKSILGIMAKSAGVLLASTDKELLFNNIDRLLSATAALGDLHKIDAEKALRDTWDKVCKRNWVENPNDADKQGVRGNTGGPGQDGVPGVPGAQGSGQAPVGPTGAPQAPNTMATGRIELELEHATDDRKFELASELDRRRTRTQAASGTKDGVQGAKGDIGNVGTPGTHEPSTRVGQVGDTGVDGKNSPVGHDGEPEKKP